MEDDAPPVRDAVGALALIVMDHDSWWLWPGPSWKHHHSKAKNKESCELWHGTAPSVLIYKAFHPNI
jgi:hypothetical protein